MIHIPSAIATVAVVLASLHSPALRARTDYSSLQQRQWDEWKPAKGWPGLDYRVRCGSYNEYALKTEWWVQFRNRYQQRINIGFDMSDQGVDLKDVTRRTSIRSGGTDESWTMLKSTCGQQIVVWVHRVRFGDDDTGPYATPTPPR